MSTPNDMMKDDYITKTGVELADMRILVEGAVYLYNEQTSSLFRLAYQHDAYSRSAILAAIGSALHDLRSHICDLQEAYAAVISREISAEGSGHQP